MSLLIEGQLHEQVVMVRPRAKTLYKNNNS